MGLCEVSKMQDILVFLSPEPAFARMFACTSVCGWYPFCASCMAGDLYPRSANKQPTNQQPPTSPHAERAEPLDLSAVREANQPTNLITQQYIFVCRMC